MNDVAWTEAKWHTVGTMADEPKSLRIRLGPQGRIVIPAHFRRAMGVEPGEPLVATLEGEGRLVIETRKAAWASLRRQLRAAIPDGVDLVEELIAERRAEARREEAEVEAVGAADGAER
jgi:AbrB family looped-hinge helix DNA binding protein